MYTGILWFDNSTKPLKTKIENAQKYYVEKHGKSPTICLVNPVQANKQNLAEIAEALKITIRPDRIILSGHLWIGVEEEQK